MGVFLHLRMCSFKIVAFCVFWTLVLLNPQPSDGVIPDGEYGTFYDHYGPNLQGLTVGDVFEKQWNGALLLIYSQRYYFQMNTDEVTKEQREIRCHLYMYPKPGGEMRLLKKVRPAPYVESTLALIDRKFLRMLLPFHWKHCNKFHYMKYILYGELTDFPGCVLAAAWIGVPESDIRNGKFKLRGFYATEPDSTDNSPRHGSRFEPPYKRARGEASRQVRGSGSPGQLKRSRSWEQAQASSFRRMVLCNPFKYFSKKRASALCLNS